MAEPVKRVVLGAGPDGGTEVQFDGDSPHVVEVPGMAGLALTDLWYTDGTPASLDGAADAAARDLSVTPPTDGTLFRIVEFPPDSAIAAAGGTGAGAAASLGVGAGGGGEGSGEGSGDGSGDGSTDGSSGGGGDHLMWHQTDTVDFNCVLSGRLALVHDSGRVELGPGDTVIVRGIRHAWSNPGDEVARLVAVAVDAHRSG